MDGCRFADLGAFCLRERCGDLNGDGAVTLIDVIRLMKMITA